MRVRNEIVHLSFANLVVQSENNDQPLARDFFTTTKLE